MNSIRLRSCDPYYDLYFIVAQNLMYNGQLQYSPNSSAVSKSLLTSSFSKLYYYKKYLLVYLPIRAQLKGY